MKRLIFIISILAITASINAQSVKDSTVFTYWETIDTIDYVKDAGIEWVEDYWRDTIIKGVDRAFYKLRVGGEGVIQCKYWLIYIVPAVKKETAYETKKRQLLEIKEAKEK